MPDNNAFDTQRPKSQLTRDRSRSDVADSPELEEMQKQAVQDSIEHLHGPESIDYAKDELVVLTQVRNSKPYLKSFIEHYFSLGAKHIVFLDNGSTDGTVEALKKYKNSTVLRTALPYRTYNVAMKQYLIERFGRGRWSLLVDIDELFDYPFSDVLGLKELLGYLNHHGYTAVVAHMLDMFPGEPISQDAPLAEDEPLKEKYRFYDLSNTTAFDYQDAEGFENVVSNEEIEVLQGGVQKTLFNIHPLLTKHPLIFYDDKIRPVDLSEHWAGGARVADITGVLLHYKLLGLYELVRREIKERTYPNRHGKYDKYSEVLEQTPSLLIKKPSSKELESVNDLIGTQYNTISEEYVTFVARKVQENEGSWDSVPGRVFKPLLRVCAETKVDGKRIRGLRSRVSQLHTQVKQHQQQAEQLQTDLENELDKERRKVLALDYKNSNLETKVQNLEHQLQVVQSSNVWRLLNALDRVRSRATSVFDRSNGGRSSSK